MYRVTIDDRINYANRIKRNVVKHTKHRQIQGMIECKTEFHSKALKFVALLAEFFLEKNKMIGMGPINVFEIMKRRKFV